MIVPGPQGGTNWQPPARRRQSRPTGARATPRPARPSGPTTAPVVTAWRGPVAADAERVRAQITNGGGGMPAFSGTLSEQQIADTTAYVVEEIAGG